MKLHYLNCKKIETAIRRAKKMLFQRAKKNGLYENFGQKEVRMIGDHFIDLSDYGFKMNRNRRTLDIFNDWCMNFNGRDLQGGI